jgi:CIC family chloride channel protein
VREWLDKEENYNPNYFIISSDAGEYKGILSSSSLFGGHHSPDKLIGSLVKRNNIFVAMSDSLHTAVETMAKENVDVLPVVSGENAAIIGILSYHDIIATYKISFEEHEKKQKHLSLERYRLKILVRGQKLISLLHRNGR